MLVLWLVGWPLAARAQGCYIAGNGDYICDTYQAAGRARPGPDVLPQFTPRAVSPAVDRRQAVEDLVNLSRSIQDSVAEARAAAAAAFAPGGKCAFISTGDAPSVSGSSFYASPNGKGDCSAGSPCSLQAAIDKAGPGDEVVLKDGAYRQFVRFKRSGAPGKPIVLRAENPQKAVIELPNGVREGKGGGNNSVINTRPHSHITISGLTIDGRGQGESGITADDGSNLIIENNHVRNTGSGGISMKGSENSVIRFNLVEDLGNSFLGEGMYIGQFQGKAPVKNVEIYGNTIRGARMNFIDLKRGNENVNVHHNIFEDLVPGRARPDLGAGSASDGLILMGETNGRGSRFEDNIISNVTRDNPGQALKVSQNSNHVVQNNVFYNLDNKRAISGHQKGGSGPSAISSNTFCGLNSYDVNGSAGPIGGIKIGANKMNAPQSACNTEEQRIMNEMQNLPSGGGTWDCSSAQSASMDGGAGPAAAGLGQGAGLGGGFGAAGSAPGSPVSCPAFNSSSVAAVSDCGALKSAAQSAKPGTEIVVRGGNYSCGQINLSASGVLIRPDGNVTLRSGTNFRVTGDNNIISGFFFDKGYVHVEKGNGNRITGNTFTGGNRPAVWLIQSSGNRVDHNEIGNWNERGIALRGRTGQNCTQDSPPVGNIIDHNYIHDLEVNRENGTEAFQIGNDKACSDHNHNTLIEYNLVERATSDSEIISVKSSGNVIRYNTFDNTGSRNNKGKYVSFQIRHGRNNTVQNNTLININALSALGEGHKIIGNVVQNGAISLPAGHVQQDGFSAITQGSFFPRAENTLVAGNRADRILVGNGAGAHSNIDMAAMNNTLAGNTGRIIREMDNGTNVQGNYSGDTGQAARLRPSDAGPGSLPKSGASCHAPRQ